MPPLSLRKSTYALLAGSFNVVEQQKLILKDLRFPTNSKRNLLILHSFAGLPIKVPEAKITYYVHGLTETTKPDDIAKNFYLQEDYHVPANLKESLSAPYIRGEVLKLQAEGKDIVPQLGEDIRLRSDEDLI